MNFLVTKPKSISWFVYIFDLLPISVCLAYNEDKKKDTNPFSYKNFLSDDLASRNKRVLQVLVYLFNLS